MLCECLCVLGSQLLLADVLKSLVSDPLTHAHVKEGLVF